VRSFRGRPVGWRGESYRHYLASKGVSTRGTKYLASKGIASSRRYGVYKADGADLKSYLGENLRSNGQHETFGEGVRKLLSSPVSELDKSWSSMERSAGQDGIPASDPAERLTERGAALVGNVVTFANVEPLVDQEKDQNFRESVVDLLFGRDSVEGMRKSYAAKKSSDFMRVGGETYFVTEGGELVNVKDTKDMMRYDDELQDEESVLEQAGVIPYESAFAVRSAFAEPVPFYARKLKDAGRFRRMKTGVVGKVQGIPIKVQRIEKEKVYPVTPYDVQVVLGRMPREDVRGIVAVEFVNPTGEQQHAWAQYVRSSRKILIFSQPLSGGRVDNQDPVWLRKHIKEYVLSHEVGHHKALKTGFTDKDVRVAEARADAHVVGLAPFDRDVYALRKV